MKGVLSLELERKAYYVARTISDNARQRNGRDRYGGWNKADGFALNLQGALAEAAVHQEFGWEWDPGPVQTRHDPDVGDVDVRGTAYATGGLLIHPDDPDERRVVLVIVRQRQYDIRGWVYYGEGKVPHYWWTAGKYPCYRVPQSALRPPATLMQEGWYIG